ncbi:MAG: hypothetical protein R3C19_07400 [Planctomycetaceae bacterium]
MARSEAKRRRQLEKKRQKRTDRKHDLIRRHGAGLAEKLTRLAAAPIVECLLDERLEDRGIGYILIARRSAAGEYAMACFLLDIYCMGVKDCFGVVCRASEFSERLEKMQEVPLSSIDPASARRLVEDAVEFARDLGLSPHKDYRSVKQIFGDINPDQAQETFEMGRDGKPLFIPGPFQSAAEVRMVMAKIHQAAGDSGAAFVVDATALSDDDFEEIGFDPDSLRRIPHPDAT